MQAAKLNRTLLQVLAGRIGLAQPVVASATQSSALLVEPPVPSTAGQVPEPRARLGATSAIFAPFAELDGDKTIRKVLGPVVEALREDQTTAVPEGCPTIAARDGSAPIVGVPQDFMPGYVDGKVAKKIDSTVMPRLPNLTERERAWETAFAEQLCTNLATTVQAYRSGLVTDGVYSVDAAKRLFPGWGAKRQPTSDAERKVRAEGNAALHATATVVANLAFMQRLDELAQLPHFAPEKEVVITVGGAGAGKGTALESVLKEKKYGAVFDAAGEGESTDCMAKLKACLQRGIRVRFVAVYAHPKAAAKRLIERAQTSGRIVDLIAFARSHTVGVETFREVCASAEYAMAKEQGLVATTVLERTPAGKVVKTERETMPEPSVTTDEILHLALHELAKEDTSGLPKRVLRGALTGIATRWPEYDTVFDKREATPPVQSTERTP